MDLSRKLLNKKLCHTLLKYHRFIRAPSLASFSTSRPKSAQITVRDALNAAMDEEMEKDEKG
ncbi:hypothetical protein X975_12598, partial [Stegodyphus mimosarum]